jgi:hypothetical protein
MNKNMPRRPRSTCAWSGSVSCTRLRRSIFRFRPWLAMLFSVAACHTPDYTPHIPVSFQEAAGIHLAVLSIAPWAEYESLLEPDIAITFADAQGMALPVTSNYTREVYDALTGKLKVGWDKNAPADAAQAASSAGASSGASANGGGGKATKKAAGGGTPGASAPDATSAPAKTTGASTPDDSGTKKPAPQYVSDPLMQHQLALSVYQEMQILNRYLKDAAFKRGWKPYVVRTQISVSPYAHLQPYDLYVDLGAFLNCKPQPSAASSGDIQAALVMPLLVTDNIEAQQASNTIKLARDLALGLGGSIGDVSLQGDLEKVSKNLEAIFGMDYNSLYMVSRVTDSVMQVRLGAPVNTKSRYSMSTVTHNITMVVLLPTCEQPTTHTQLNITAVSRLRRAESGEVLKVDSDYGVDQGKQVMARFFTDPAQLAKAQNPDLITALVRYVRITDYRKFFCELQKHGLPTNSAQALWTQLADVGASSEYDIAYTDVPPDDTGQLAAMKQTVYLQDGADNSTATVMVDPSIIPVTQSAELTLGKSIHLVASSIESKNHGRTLEIQFPPLAPLRSMPHHPLPNSAGQLPGATLVLAPAAERWDMPAPQPEKSPTGTDTPKKSPTGTYTFESVLYLPAIKPAAPNTHQPRSQRNASSTHSSSTHPARPVAVAPLPPAPAQPAGPAQPGAPSPPAAPAHGEHGRAGAKG